MEPAAYCLTTPSSALSSWVFEESFTEEGYLRSDVQDWIVVIVENVEIPKKVAYCT